MGRAKAWLPWQGQPMVAHAVSILRSVVDEVVVVASETLELPSLDAEVVRDREPGLGPLAGIREGLEGMRSDLAFVTGTDAPFLSSAFVESMLSHRCAAAPEIDGHVQTLSAVYPRSALTQIEAMLAGRQLRPLHLLEALDYRRVGADELPDLDSVRGFNTPDEYLDALRRLGGDTSAYLELSGQLRSVLGRGEFEVAIGTLGELLAVLPASLGILDGDRVAAGFSVSLADQGEVRNTAVPVGPGERVRIAKSVAGG